ncbi:precorrin-2 dehydrogenase/sirohydrochlorin ferrochelatase family protein [Urinicoccus massiliensis]|uniref:precorrin-2 dehydrogenase/sirohydrochlorin ferrochelatase family protein n=1 Tax=Urinicoccus massiliensis TaxID=1723382 RepID=UPI000931FF00|nr:bifunctional precorrin-2 dehydrogenase/sirohydrochlorin ferrochelatase [Urinicoccus massiliensis]
MKYYPISINSTDKKVLVLGGGQIASRKIKSLLRGKFEIYVLAEDFDQDLVDLVRLYPHRLHLKGQVLRKDFVFMGYDLLVIATGDPDLNQAMEDYAKTKKILYVRCDKRGDSSFIMEKILQRGPIHGSLSSDGLSPTLTMLIGQEVQDFLEDYDLEKLDLLTQVRDKLMDLDPQDRSQIVKDLFKQDKDAVKKYLEEKNENQTRDPEEQPGSGSDPASGQDA